MLAEDGTSGPLASAAQGGPVDSAVEISRGRWWSAEDIPEVAGSVLHFISGGEKKGEK